MNRVLHKIYNYQWFEKSYIYIYIYSFAINEYDGVYIVSVEEEGIITILARKGAKKPLRK